MNAASSSVRQLRVLSVFPHRRLAGHVVLDETGLLRDASFIVDVRRHRPDGARSALIERRVQASISAYRPDLVVVVSDSRGCAFAPTACDVVKSHGLPVRTFHERELDATFATVDGSQFDRLGQAVTGTFFPELRHRGGSWALASLEQRRLRRPVWKAAAGAIAVLAEARPQAVLALARAPVPPGLASLLERASRTPTQ